MLGSNGINNNGTIRTNFILTNHYKQTTIHMLSLHTSIFFLFFFANRFTPCVPKTSNHTTNTLKHKLLYKLTETIAWLRHHAGVFQILLRFLLCACFSPSRMCVVSLSFVCFSRCFEFVGVAF